MPQKVIIENADFETQLVQKLEEITKAKLDILDDKDAIKALRWAVKVADVGGFTN